eukprot:3316838-Amphidinium_carterae.1
MPSCCAKHFALLLRQCCMRKSKVCASSCWQIASPVRCSEPRKLLDDVVDSDAALERATVCWVLLDVEIAAPAKCMTVPVVLCLVV